jgi:hypothetical protein
MMKQQRRIEQAWADYEAAARRATEAYIESQRNPRWQHDHNARVVDYDRRRDAAYAVYVNAMDAA